MQDNTATRGIRARGDTRQKTRRSKPQRTIRRGDTMGLLQTHNIHCNRQGSQPLKEASPFGLISNSIAIKGKDRQRHGGGRGKNNQTKTGEGANWNLEPHQKTNETKNNLNQETKGEKE